GVTLTADHQGTFNSQFLLDVSDIHCIDVHSNKRLFSFRFLVADLEKKYGMLMLSNKKTIPIVMESHLANERFSCQQDVQNYWHDKIENRRKSIDSVNTNNSESISINHQNSG
ncbi:971_t:CDS:2, partial [Ambispora leptoticha]